MNVIAPVPRRTDPAETFLFNGTKKITRISSSVQSRFRHRSGIESTREGEARFHRRVIECADNEVFAVVSLRTIRELPVFLSDAALYFRPGNVRANRRQDRHRTSHEDQSGKSESTGPPIRISMGSRFHSYS